MLHFALHILQNTKQGNHDFPGLNQRAIYITIMPINNYAIAGFGNHQDEEKTWIIPSGIKVHFLSYEYEDITFGQLAGITMELVAHPEKTPCQVAKTITGDGTTQARDYKIYPLSLAERNTINGIIGASSAFTAFRYAPYPGPTYFSDFVYRLPISCEMHVYLLACHNI